MLKKCKIKFKIKRDRNGEKKSFKVRNRVNFLYFTRGLSKRSIAKEECVSRGFVGKWTKAPDQDPTEDRRGWPMGKRRKWNKSVENKIKRIRKDLEGDPSQFFIGASAIEQEWRKRYPDTSPPPLRTIGQILSDLGLARKNKRGRNKGAAKYLCYPEYTIYTLLGERVLEVDFLGEKYITGRTEPLNFIGYSFKKEPRLRYFKRVSGQAADDFIEQTRYFLKRFEKPDYIKVDNCAATIGSVSGRRNISRVMKFLLENQITPIFAVPKKPFTQASIEGNNSVFSRKFWNRIKFKSLEEVDLKLEWFNKSSQEYTGYHPPERKCREKEDFIPKVYFIRQVKEDEKGDNKGCIDVLHEKLHFPKSYINYFLLAEWNLMEEKIYIRFEKNKKSEIIKILNFKINQRSKKKCQNLLKV